MSDKPKTFTDDYLSKLFQGDRVNQMMLSDPRFAKSELSCMRSLGDISQPCPEVGDRDTCSRCGEWLDDCECEPDHQWTITPGVSVPRTDSVYIATEIVLEKPDDTES